jgi:hypothetical protein
MPLEMKRAAKLIPLFVACILVVDLYAQKQPQIQDAGLYAPANVKIDGKLNEWQNPFINTQKFTGFLSAFNPSCRIYYTLANDEKNLYLIVRGLGNGVSKKVLAGGMILTISHAAEKKNRTKDPGNVAITFPVPQDPKTTALIMNTINQIQDLTEDSIANRKQIDSLDAIADKMVNNAMKEIRVVGVKEISDSAVSVFNTEGIKAAMQFIQVQAAIEIAIPLKYLGLSANNPATFSYNIRIDAVPVASRAFQVDPNKPAPEVVVGGTVMVMSNISPNNGYAWNPTDFWGEYTLAKKP